MKKALMTVVKGFKPLYSCYYYIGSTVINIIRLFIKPKDNIILFISYGGKKYDDSPRVIYEKMVSDPRFSNFEFVWAFNNPDDIEILEGRKIKVDTLEYFITALEAGCWITNSKVERGLNFKGKNTFYVNTWHGTPIKKMGSDIDDANKSFNPKLKYREDVMLAQGNFEADIFSRVFGIDREKFYVCGLPRNDELNNIDDEIRKKVLNKLNISQDKKVILYAPTFREYERDSQMNCVIDPPINVDKWEKMLGKEYIVLFRAHYEVAKALNLENRNDDFIKDVSNYPALNELMIASDILISDYSSIFFDYSILNKAMIAYTYDYEKYVSERGMYFDIRDELPGGSITEEELLELIKKSSERAVLDKVKAFRQKYVEVYGEATDKALDIIYDNLKKGEIE